MAADLLSRRLKVSPSDPPIVSLRRNSLSEDSKEEEIVKMNRSSKVDKMDMSTLDELLEEFPVQKSNPHPSSTVGRNVLFIICGLAVTTSPIYLFCSTPFGLSFDEHWMLFTVVTVFSTSLMINSYKSSCLKQEKKLVDTRSRMLLTMRQSVRGKKKQQQVDLEQVLEANLANTSAVEGAAYALWVNNLLYLCMFFSLTFALRPRFSEDGSYSEETYVRANCFNYFFSVGAPALFLGVTM